jgi:multidrug resistance efflux pump
LAVDEGDGVRQGQRLVRLDRTLLDAEIAEAEAAIATAQAQLDQVMAGVREEEVGQVEAAVVLAQAQMRSAEQAVVDAILLRDNQQALDLEIAAARTQVRLNELAFQRAIPVKDASELAEALAHRGVDFAEKIHHYSIVLGGSKYSGTFTLDEGTKRQASADWNLQGTYLWQAWISLEEARTRLDTAQAHLGDLLELQSNPLALDLAVVQAEAAHKEAAAAVPVARANVSVVKAGASDEQIAVFEAQVDQARANLEALEVKQDKYRIHSPIEGQVIERVVTQGERVLQGSTLMTLGNLDRVELTVYVPEPDMGRVDLGQSVEVTVDTFPGKPFHGKVTMISQEAEFTPKNVQTKEERANTVFAVKVEIPNQEHRLRPGMPADAVFVEPLAQ